MAPRFVLRYTEKNWSYLHMEAREMRWMLLLFAALGFGCGDDKDAPARTGGDEATPPLERLAILEEIGELAFYQMVATPYEKRVQIGRRNPECEQVTPRNFEEHWPEFDLFVQECLEPDFVLTNNGRDPAANRFAVRAFTQRRTDEVELGEIKPDEDFDVELHHFYDGSDIEDEMNNPFWEFVAPTWERGEKYWMLALTPETDRLSKPGIFYDPTLHLDLCAKGVRVCSESAIVFGVNPSIEGPWEVAEGPPEYAAERVKQFDRTVFWTFVNGGNTARGTLEFGELKVSFEAGEGPSGVLGSGSFRVSEITSADEMRASFQHSQPGEGQKTGEILFRKSL